VSSASDSFARANNASLGPNWSGNILNPNPNSYPAAQILSNAVASASGSFLGFYNSFQIYKTIVPQTPDQLVTAQISAVAPSTSVISITGCTANTPIAGQATYNYTLTSGAGLVQPQEIIITGMTNGANNVFALTVSVTGSTFVIANAGAITEAGSTGTGVTPTDSLLGCVARCSADQLNNYFQFIGNNSAYFGAGNGTVPDNRQYCREAWKTVAGSATTFGGVQLLAAVDAVNDVYALLAAGKKIAAFRNKAILYGLDDTGVTGIGYWGLVADSANVSGHTTPFAGQTMASVTGTQWKNWTARDVGSASLTGAWTKKAEESFNAAPNYAGNWTVQGQLANQITFTAAGGSAGGVGIGSNAGGGNSGIWTGRAWANDQAAELICYSMTGNTSMEVLVRANTGASATFYLLQFVSTAGSGTTIGAGTWSLSKFVSGTQTGIIAPTSITITSLDCLRLEAQGTTLTCYINGVQVGQATDSSIASGSPGLMINGTSTQVMYWSGDEVATTFNISGSAAGLSGVTMTYTGPSSGSVTSDAFGNYSITGLAAGTYTITPSKTGVTFSPAAAIVPVSSANVTENFATGGGGGDLGPGFDLKLRL